MKRLLLVVAASASLVCASAKTTSPLAWRELEPGLQYAKTTLSPQEGSVLVHLFRANMKTWKPVALDAKALTRKPRSRVVDLAEKAAVPLAVNATFFDENGAALGLLQAGPTIHNPLRNADWGVLAVKGTAGSLVHTKEFAADPTIDFAVQCGPRAVVAGKPTKLKAQGASARTGLCLTAPDELVVLVTEGLITASEIAQFLARSRGEGGVGCSDALLLDGGPSTQIWAKAGDVALDMRGGWPVPNGVGLARR